METYLYYSYLKFRHENKKAVWVVLNSIPWWIYLPLAMSLVGCVICAFICNTDQGNVWWPLLLIGSLGCMGVASLGIEYVQIKDSAKRMENFWTHIRRVKKFLEENGITTKEDVAEIMQRVQKRLENARQEQKAMKESDEKWLQMLAIPLVLAGFAAVVEKSENLFFMLVSATGLTMIFVLLFIVFCAVVR